MNIVLNIKPVSWLTISPTLGVHSGLPKKVFGNADKYTVSAGGKNLILYKRDIESYDNERTLPSVPFSFKITFHHYFPRSKAGIEIYASLDNIFSLFYNPDRKERVDKYTGDIIQTSGEPYETYQYGFGIRITY